MTNGGTDKTLKIHIAPLIREALSAAQFGEDFDEALLRTLKARHPEEATALFTAISQLIELEVQQTKASKEQTLHHLAEAAPGPEITLNIGGVGNISKIVTESKTYRVNGQEYHSLEEMPFELRRRVEEGLSQARQIGPVRRKARVGCTFSLLGGLVAIFGRILGK
jgi:hypothetical protein